MDLTPEEARANVIAFHVYEFFVTSHSSGDIPEVVSLL
jgi:hypothetical protein